jgi:hypothetical protein
VKRAEDISFILLGISISLSCAVQYFHSAVILLLLMAGFSFSKTFFPTLKFFSPGVTLITVHSDHEIEFASIAKELAKLHGSPSIISSQSADDYHSIVFSIRGQNASKHADLVKAIRGEGRQGLRVDVFYPGNELNE